MKLVNHILSITKSRCNLRAFRAAASLILLTALFSCEDELVIVPCETGDCNAYIYSDFYKDSNGYYHAELDWSREYYPYFPLKVYADRTAPEYVYNMGSVVSAEFDTDSYFVLGDSIAFTISLYQPWQGLETYYGTPIPYENTTVYLNQFEGTVVPVVQNTDIYFSHDMDGDFSTTRIVGPFPPTMIGDTISIFMKVKWDIGMIIEKDHYIEKFIIE